MLNDSKVQFASSQKHLVLILDSGLDFFEHIGNKIKKYKEIIGMMKKSSLTQSKKFLLKIYNKNYPSLMLNDIKWQFETSPKNFNSNFKKSRF